MQVTNILFRLSNLLNLNFAHLNDHLQTILQFEGDKVALTHIIKDKDTDPEDISEALVDINDLFSAYLSSDESIVNHIINYEDSDNQKNLQSFQYDFEICFIKNIDEVNTEKLVKVDNSKLLSLTTELPINTKFKSFEDLIDKLDETQKEIYLPSLAGKKLAVIGPAGTGKTILATSLAKKQSDENKKVLFLTYNIKLANYVRDVLSQTNVDVFTAHSYFANVLIEASRNISNTEITRNLNLYKAASYLLSHESQGHSVDYGLTADWYEEKLASYYVQAIHIDSQNLYDTIIIDEMQLFPTWWLSNLTFGLKNQETGTFALFGDPLQDIYGSKNLPAWLDEVKELSINYRNSIEIYTFLEKLVDLTNQSSIGTSVQDINKIVVNSNDEILSNIISETESYMKQGITPNQITILCINSDTKNIVENFIEIKHFIQQGVTVDSVRRYTGLENDVIILVIPDKSVFPASINDSKTKNYLYIAASRASSILSILSTKEFFEEFL